VAITSITNKKESFDVLIDPAIYGERTFMQKEFFSQISEFETNCELSETFRFSQLEIFVTNRCTFQNQDGKPTFKP
jgi:hypothetical protein